MSSKASIVLIEDKLSLARCYQAFLSAEAVDVHVCRDLESAELALQQYQSELVIFDIGLGRADKMSMLMQLKTSAYQHSLIILSDRVSGNVSKQIISMDVDDFLEKPFSKDRFCLTVRNAIDKQQAKRASMQFAAGFHGFVGSSMAMQNVYRIIESAASSKASVFVTGESGTGKEVCAQAIHDTSLRMQREFVSLNCAAIPRDLMESEIFGHVKGAFTGADAAREGAARKAHEGTLFLDEIGEMDLDLQSKLLRFIQLGQFQKVGASAVENVDVRFISATNRDPLQEVAMGRFREDLYYRLHVVPIHLPPLRDRDRDVLQIANKFLLQYSQEEGKHFVGFTPDTESIFLEYAWPGNVRQLLNVLRNVVVLNQGELVSPEMLPSPLNQFNSGAISGVAMANQEPEQASMNSQNNIVSHSPESTPNRIIMPPERNLVSANGENINLNTPPLNQALSQPMAQPLVESDGHALSAQRFHGARDRKSVV